MCMASRKRNPFFRRPHVLTRWSLAELENPHWPAPLYSVRASMEKAVCLTECLWCFLTAPPNPPPTYPFVSPRTLRASSTSKHSPASRFPESLSLCLCFSPVPTPSPLTATRSWQVRGGHPITRTGHWPLASSDSHLRRRHNQSRYWEYGEIKKRKRNSFVCLSVCSSLFRIPISFNLSTEFDLNVNRKIFNNFILRFFVYSQIFMLSINSFYFCKIFDMSNFQGRNIGDIWWY